MCKNTMSQSPENTGENSVPEMTSSLGDDLEKEINGIFDSYKEYHLSCRVKVYFLGDGNAGKTSLVQSLVADGATLADAPSEGVSQHIWRPFRGKNSNDLLSRPPSIDEKNLILNLWDMTGRKVCQGIHQLFLTRALYVLVFNLDDSDSCQRLPTYISYVQAKIPGCPMLLVATRGDKLFTEEDRKQKAAQTLAGMRAAQQAEIDAIKNDITQISEFGADPTLLKQLEWLEGLLERRPKLPDSVMVVSCKTGKGLMSLRQKLVSMALNVDLFPHTSRLVKPELVHLCEVLDERWTQGELLITWNEFRMMVDASWSEARNGLLKKHSTQGQTDAELKKHMEFLEQMGFICGLRSIPAKPPDGNPVNYICLAPQTLAALLCFCHVDNPRKAFRFEAKRFWPSSATKPDPGTLVKLLEEIPRHGLLREALLPLIWQDVTLSQTQIERLTDLLTTSGLLTLQAPNELPAIPPSTAPPVASLSLPGYPGLSDTKRFHLNLMCLVPDKKPHLNWAAKPFKGDIQLTWRYSFPCGTPPGLTQRMLRACRSAAVNENYTHQWRYGLIIKLDDAIVCTEIDTVDLYVDVSCRVNADDPTEETEAVQFMWAHLAPFIKATLDFLKQWPGLVYKIEVIPSGTCFFKDETMGGEQAFLIGQCFMSAKMMKPVTFTEGGVERSLDGEMLIQFDNDCNSLEEWLAVILSKREAVIERRSVTPLTPFIKPTQHKDSTDSIAKKPRKKLELKWDIEETPTRKKQPAVSSDTGHNNNNNSSSSASSKRNSAQEDQDKRKNSVKKDSSEKDKSFVMSEEDQLKEANRVASGFIASILAQAVAEYIQAVHEDNHNSVGQQLVTKAQVEAARLTANAVIAVHSGDIDLTAQTVMDVAKALRTDKAHSGDQNVKSRTCLIL